jgi:glycogen synthase
MKILLMSYAYPPDIGGIERFSSLMRGAFEARGHELRVVTEARRAAQEDQAHRVLRNPDRAALARAIEWADLCFVSGVSLRYQVPVLLQGKPLVVTHHGWQYGLDGKISNAYRVKRFFSRFALNIAVSRALADDLPAPALAIHNPFEGSIDAGLDFLERPRDLAFLGRLVDQKGVNLLLEAMAKLGERGIATTATIIGDGPERARLERRAAETLAGKVEFLGSRKQGEIHNLLLRHRMLVAPSLSREGFGMAVLDGLAAGCVAIGSAIGGLPESVGKCGLTFPEGNSGALAECIAGLLAHPGNAASFRAAIPAHLDALRLDRIAERYLEIFQRLYEYQAVMKLGRGKAIRQTVSDLQSQSK